PPLTGGLIRSGRQSVELDLNLGCDLLAALARMIEVDEVGRTGLVLGIAFLCLKVADSDSLGCSGIPPIHHQLMRLSSPDSGSGKGHFRRLYCALDCCRQT